MKIATETENRVFKDLISNGLTLVTVEMPHIHTVEIAMFIRAGLRFETPENNGVSHFLEHMMFRGNKRYPDSIALNLEFEKIGRDLRASTLCEYTYYGFGPHHDQLERGLELFSEFFQDPLFPSIDLEREIILEEYLEDLNAEGNNIDINNLACRLLYEGTPLAMPTIGTEATIKAIDEAMLRQYFKTYYNPGNMVLAVAGRLTHEQVLPLVERDFGQLPVGGRVIHSDHFKNSVPENQKKPAVLVQHHTDSQVQLQICFRSFSYNDPDYYTLCLINRMFDDGVTSRLQRALREEKGLVYSVDSRVTSMSDIGTFDFDVVVRAEKLIPVTEIIFQEIRRFLDKGPDVEELAHVKQRYLYDLDLDLDDPYKQIIRHGFCQLYSYEVSIEQERAIIEGITMENIRRVAAKVFVPEVLNAVVVGPTDSDLENQLETLVYNF